MSETPRGKLKIFFGMCAGVGKTYAMLEAAHEAYKQHLDVVIGLVETHGRKETQRLADGLESLPLTSIEYRSTTLREFNLDAALERKPQILLVDELAHTNVPGSRHARRYQDIEELLHNGINVYTTLNVQHLESRADVVAQISGINIHETVPDEFFENADEIELVDIPPETLLSRLHEGKVYSTERSVQALQSFFRKGTLTALREMSLRITANRVDKQLRSYMRHEHIVGPWKSGARLLVAVSAAPTSAELIRWTCSMAEHMNATWLAVHIENDIVSASPNDEAIRKHILLARNLGGEVQIVASTEIVQTLIEIASRENVTQIVVGKPLKKNWNPWKRSLVDQLIHNSGNIDVYAVRLQSSSQPNNSLTHNKLNIQLRSYVTSSCIILAVVILGLILTPILGYQSIGLLLLGTMCVLGLFYQRGPLLLSATLSALLWNMLFIPPLFTFYISRTEDVIMIVLYMVIAMVTGTLTSKLRLREQTMRVRESRTAVLFSLSKALSEPTGADILVSTAIRELKTVLHAEIAVLLITQPTQQLLPHPSSTFLPTEKDISIASWSLKNNKMSGRFTSTLESSETTNLPIIGSTTTHGVIAIRYNQQHLAPEQQALVENCVQLIAVALDRDIITKQARSLELSEQSEQLRSTILSSVSHELRTPLSVLGTAADTLKNESTFANPQLRSTILYEIDVAIRRLTRVVDHLLNINRLETGTIRALEQWCDITDLLQTAILIASPSAIPFTLTINNNLPFVKADEALLEQAITTILENAIKHTASGTRIDVIAENTPKEISIRIRDYGQGVPPNELSHLFEKFYRGSETQASGSGLGLAIAKGFIETQGGSISASLPPGGGLQITIALPLERSFSPFEEV